MCYTMSTNGKRYPEEFKRQIIDLYLSGKPVSELAEEYGVVDQTIYKWKKAAAFPFVKELKDYDFDFQPGVNEQEMRELASLGFLEKNENIVFLGPSGVGKTHLATAIGVAAAKKRVSTYFIKCNDLLQQLKRAQLENRLDARLKHFSKYKLLIVDEIGYLPINKEDSNMFFQLIDMRYEKKSTILTTNMNFNEWDGVFYDAVVANAIMDRVLHHSHVIPISGKSYRLKDHLSQTD